MLNILLDQMESVRFASEMNVCSGFNSFRRTLAQHETTHALIQHLQRFPEHRRNVFQRLLTLLDANDQPEYAHPYDPALAGYLYALSEIDYKTASEAAQHILQTPKLWWSRKLARYVLKNVRETDSRQIQWSHSARSVVKLPRSEIMLSSQDATFNLAQLITERPWPDYRAGSSSRTCEVERIAS